MDLLRRLFKKDELKGLQVKVKKMHKDAVIPKYAKDGDAGLDLTAVSCSVDKYGNATYRTGLAFEIPEGYVGMLFPRSSISKQSITLCNCVGIIDSGYRGEVIMKFKPLIGEFNHLAIKHKYSVWADKTNIYSVGERIGQIIIMPYPQIRLVEAGELSETERGDKGFGSSGK